jgi:hypothetical protein
LTNLQLAIAILIYARVTPQEVEHGDEAAIAMKSLEALQRKAQEAGTVSKSARGKASPVDERTCSDDCTSKSQLGGNESSDSKVSLQMRNCHSKPR